MRAIKASVSAFDVVLPQIDRVHLRVAHPRNRHELDHRWSLSWRELRELAQTDPRYAAAYAVARARMRRFRADFASTYGRHPYEDRNLRDYDSEQQRA